MTLLGLQAPIVPQKFFHWLMGFPGDSDGKEFTCSAGDMGSIPGLGKSPGEGTGYPLQYSCLVEKEMATHSSILAWRILWTEEPGGLLCMGSHRVRHNWSDLACMHALEKEMATHSNILTWRIPGTEEPGWLLSMGSHRIRHDWSDLAAAATAAASTAAAFLTRESHGQRSLVSYSPWVHKKSDMTKRQTHGALLGMECGFMFLQGYCSSSIFLIL